jgi:hypothetical protein
VISGQNPMACGVLYIIGKLGILYLDAGGVQHTIGKLSTKATTLF